MKRTDKETLISTMADIFKSAQVGFLVDYRGLSVGDITELRGKLHESSAQMRILKNRIAKIAIKDTPFASLETELTEPRALIYSDDPVNPAKVVVDFEKSNEKFQYISGVLVTSGEGSVLDKNRVKSLSSLPSREELLVKLLFVMNATQTSLVRTLNEVPAKFVRTLAAIAESKK